MPGDTPSLTAASWNFLENGCFPTKLGSSSYCTPRAALGLTSWAALPQRLCDLFSIHLPAEPGSSSQTRGQRSHYKLT